MEARKWEELPKDCLVDVLGRVGLESLLVDIPFVCKSWYKATLTPLCWKHLDFPDLFDHPQLTCESFVIRFKRQYRLQGEICETELVKVVVDRSAGCATMVKLPGCYTKDALIYVAKNCPALKKLVLHSEESFTMLILSLNIDKFKYLESLEIKKDFHFEEIVTEIGAHCENFVALSLDARSITYPLDYPASLLAGLDFARLFCLHGSAPKAYIGEEVMVIVSCLPKLKYLSLREVSINRENLVKILKGCVELVHLDVRDCRGFGENDEEILKLASHIPKFECSGSIFDTFDVVYY